MTCFQMMESHAVQPSRDTFTGKFFSNCWSSRVTGNLKWCFAFSIERQSSVRPNAVDKLLDDFPGTDWIQLELRPSSFESYQILNRHPVTIEDVLADFSDRQRLQTPETSRTNRRKLRCVQKASSGIFAWRPKAAARCLWFGFFFQLREFVHLGKYNSLPADSSRRLL